jgi:hypothetical protein
MEQNDQKESCEWPPCMEMVREENTEKRTVNFCEHKCPHWHDKDYACKTCYGIRETDERRIRD